MDGLMFLGIAAGVILVIVLFMRQRRQLEALGADRLTALVEKASHSRLEPEEVDELTAIGGKLDKSNHRSRKVTLLRVSLHGVLSRYLYPQLVGDALHTLTELLATTGWDVAAWRFDEPRAGSVDERVQRVVAIASALVQALVQRDLPVADGVWVQLFATLEAIDLWLSHIVRGAEMREALFVDSELRHPSRELLDDWSASLAEASERFSATRAILAPTEPAQRLAKLRRLAWGTRDPSEKQVSRGLEAAARGLSHLDTPKVSTGRASSVSSRS